MHCYSVILALLSSLSLLNGLASSYILGNIDVFWALMNALSCHYELSVFLHFWVLRMNTLSWHVALSEFMHEISVQSHTKPHCLSVLCMGLTCSLELIPCTTLSFLSLFIFHAWA